MKSLINKILLILLFTLTSHITFADNNIILGHVIAVTDGDTIKILNGEKQEFKIRLAEIDAPEKDQPYGQKSKQNLSELVFNKDVKVIKSTIDRYGRIVGYIILDDVDINLELIKNGSAWVYDYYSKSKIYKEQETIAKNAKIGLWSLQENQIISPWEWRKQNKEASFH